MNDSSVVATDEDLYEVNLPTFMSQGASLGQAAIGEVRRTDVLLLELGNLRLEGGVVAADGRCPAGESALMSFAEMLRRAAKDQLDIDEAELEVGVQPWARGGVLSRRVFVADALDNGAGYALELGTTKNMSRLLKSLRDDLGARLTQADHVSVCSTSCPACLRSYENRFDHWALNWRLGLDVVDLALGGKLRRSVGHASSRWERKHLPTGSDDTAHSRSMWTDRSRSSSRERTRLWSVIRSGVGTLTVGTLPSTHLQIDTMVRQSTCPTCLSWSDFRSGCGASCRMSEARRLRPRHHAHVPGSEPDQPARLRVGAEWPLDRRAARCGRRRGRSHHATGRRPRQGHGSSGGRRRSGLWDDARFTLADDELGVLARATVSTRPLVLADLASLMLDAVDASSRLFEALARRRFEFTFSSQFVDFQYHFCGTSLIAETGQYSDISEHPIRHQGSGDE